MRQRELLRLGWEDVDFDEALLKVRHSLQKVNGTLTLAASRKDKRRHIIESDSSALQALRRQQQMVVELALIASVKWEEWDLVFPSAVGTSLDNSNVTHRLEQMVVAAELPQQRFHDLCHPTASVIACQGGALKAIQATLDHSQIALTSNTHTHFCDEMGRDAANKIGGAMMGPA